MIEYHVPALDPYGGGPWRLPKLAVIGWPLTHTYSPVMHQAALNGAGLDLTYGSIPVQPDELKHFVRAVNSVMRGINVTTPHKRPIACHCTWLDPLAKVSGAVNTVYFGVEGDICGHNTDGPGLLTALRYRSGFEPGGSHVTIIGAGGSACAAAAALAQAGAVQITVVNRSPEWSARLCQYLREPFPHTEWQDGGLGYPGPNPSPDLILSCVPPAAARAVRHIVEEARPGTIFMDLSYGPTPTQLHRAALGACLHAVPGLEMLLWQGVLAFEIFTGVEDPATAGRMRSALVQAAGEWWLC